MVDQNGVASGTSAYVSENARYGNPTDFYGSVRQNLRHYLMRELFGFTLHPDIPRPTSGTRIGEVAVGTGLWICEVAQQYPEATCEGTDIQLHQAPPKEWLPKNVTLKTWSLFDAPPPEMIERYDVVHVRLISILIKDGNPAPIVRNIARLLKPGGWLQWDELDSTNTWVAKVDETMQTPNIDQWNAWMRGTRVEDAKGREWQLELPRYLSNAGFIHLKVEDHKPKMRQNMMLARAVTNEMLQLTDQSVGKTQGDSAEGLRMKRVVNEASKEAIEGAALMLPMNTYLAQKGESRPNSRLGLQTRHEGMRYELDEYTDVDSQTDAAPAH